MNPSHDPSWLAGDPPLRWVECDACDGNGYIDRTIRVYERGCGFSHEDGYDEQCGKCRGAGGWVEEQVSNPSSYDPTTQPYDEPFRHASACDVAPAV